MNLELGGLAPGSQHDRLVVTGPVTLDGALQMSFANGFVAGSGDFFNVLSYASRAGGFASSLGLTGESGRVYQLRASTNLGATNWFVIGVMAATKGVWRMLDPGAATNQWRFYRANQLPWGS